MSLDMSNNSSAWEGLEESVVASDPDEKRSTKDNVHGLIYLSPLLWSVIDTPQFQRLREIKQLGVSYRVFPTASHNRFEHCLGVAHLAGKLVRHLQQEQPELGITERDVTCVELAGLCHDLGHGPWSHVWDNLFIPSVLPGIKWSHEEASEMMFDDLVSSNEIPIPPEDVDFIKDLIRGKPNHSKDRVKTKLFLFQIVANEKNGIDVDKFDYICRDTRATGMGHSINTEAIIQSARVINNEICYSIKLANSLFELGHTRFTLHKMIYSHKTARAIEYMFIDALKAAEPHMKIAERIRDPKRYLHLTDNIMQIIKMSEDPALQESRDLFMRLDKRKLYRSVDFKAYDWDYYDKLCKWFTAEKIVEVAKELGRKDTNVPSEVVESLDKSHVIVDICKLHYGMKEKNPVNFVRFYGKGNHNESFIANRGDFSTLMPTCFGECMLRVISKEDKYFGIIYKAYNAILDRLNQLASLDTNIPLNIGDNLPLTPVESISTQPNSRNPSFSNILEAGLRTPSASGSIYVDGESPTSPASGGVGEKTPFVRNRGMEARQRTAVKTSPQKRSQYRPLGRDDSTTSLFPTMNAKSSSASEKELQEDVGSPTPHRVDRSSSNHDEVKVAGKLLPPFRDEGSPSPQPSSSTRRRSPRTAHDANSAASTSVAEPSRKIGTLRAGLKKKRVDTEDVDTDVEPPDGSPIRKKSKR